MSHLRHLRANQRGDTIVEVLIAIAVISLVLGGAYVTTNRSLQATRAAQERVNALKLAESQMEQIKAMAANDPTVIFGSTTTSEFCISKATGDIEVAANLSSGQPTGSPHADCVVGLSGDPATDEPRFYISIIRTGNDFVLTELWEDVSGRNNDSLQMRYRVYE